MLNDVTADYPGATYDQAFRYLFFGYGAAISWLITAFMILLIIIYMRLLRSEVEL